MNSMAGGQGFRGTTGGNIPNTATGRKVGGYKVNQLQNFTPEQMQLFQQSFSHVAPDSFLSRLAGGDQQIFDQIEQPALRQFNGIQGNIASRFSNMGSFGGRNSSGFQNTINQAGSNFAQDLQSQRQNLQRQAIMDLMGLTESLLGQKPYTNFLTKPQNNSSFLSKIFGGLLPLGGAALGGMYGGLPGAQFGLNAGQGFTNGFQSGSY